MTKKPTQKKATTGSGTGSKRRSPISRAEGETRLVEAAATLLKSRPFSEIGVRDIAAIADVNHGFVHTWFGSKNDLFIEVLRRTNERISGEIAAAPADGLAVNPFSPDVDLMVRLSLWLFLEGADPRAAFGGLPVVSTLTDRYVRQMGMDPHVARNAAMIAVSLVIATSSFAPILGMEERSELTDVFAQWRHMLGLLAQHPPA